MSAGCWRLVSLVTVWHAAASICYYAVFAATPGTNRAIFDNVAPERQHRAIGVKQVGSTAGSAVTGVLVAAASGVVTGTMPLEKRAHPIESLE